MRLSPYDSVPLASMDDITSSFERDGPKAQLMGVATRQDLQPRCVAPRSSANLLYERILIYSLDNSGW